MTNIIDILKYANENDPLKFTDIIDNILGQKAIDYLDVTRQGVAKIMFDEQNPNEESQESDENINNELENNDNDIEDYDVNLQDQE